MMESDVYRIDTDTQPLMVTIRDASKRTGCSYDFIRQKCINNEIVFVKSGNRYLINFPLFLQYLNTGDGYMKGGKDSD